MGSSNNSGDSQNVSEGPGYGGDVDVQDVSSPSDGLGEIPEGLFDQDMDAVDLDLGALPDDMELRGASCRKPRGRAGPSGGRVKDVTVRKSKPGGVLKEKIWRGAEQSTALEPAVPRRNPQVVLSSSGTEDEVPEKTVRAKVEKLSVDGFPQDVSVLSSKDAEGVLNTFDLPNNVLVRIPSGAERMHQLKEEKMSVNHFHFHYGLRFPLHPGVSRILTDLRLCVAQLNLNALAFIVAWVIMCEWKRVPCSTGGFLSFFRFTRNKED